MEVVEEVSEVAVCAEETRAGPETAVCKHWRLHYGQCFFGSGCLYRHPAITQATIDAQKAAYARKREEKKNQGKRPQVRNGSKVIVFRNFLRKVFSPEFLRSVSVLDIAGGKGELAFEMANRDHCDVTVVDPRPLSVERYHRKFVLGVFHELHLQAMGLGLLPCSPGAENHLSGERLRLWRALEQLWLDRKGPGFALDRSHLDTSDLDEMFCSIGVCDMGPLVDSVRPRHLRLFWTPILWEYIVSLPLAFNCDPANYPRDYADFLGELERFKGSEEAAFPREELLRFAFHASLTVNWTEKGLVLDGKEEKRLMDQSLLTDNELKWLTGWDDKEVEQQTAAIEWSLEDTQALLSSCGLVVGLHPDQATEGLVDFCLATGTPFAVVPCCIYTKQFSKRKLANGKQVRTVDQLVDHLMEKHPGIRSEKLNFQGKNTVLFWLGPAAKQCAVAGSY